MRVTANCPCCQKRLATRVTLNKRKKDLRRCDGCGTLLFRVNTDVQPWSLLLLLTAFLPVVLMPVVAFWLASDIGWWSLGVACTGLLWACVFDYFQSPYTHGYVLWYPTCRDCGYDMRGSKDACPECGGLATRHPETPDTAADGSE